MIPSLHTGVIGFSKSERYLAELAQGPFLSLWSHPNLFRARAKELADLVVIFGNEVVIFSDKSCEYKEGDHGWSRWYRRAVFDSAHQLHRAAGWFRKHQTEVYLDAKCERRFPLHLPATPLIHLVAVATGAREFAARHLGGDGSLAIATDADGSRPFVIGDLDRSKDFVHVFDDVSLTTVLRERDTIVDFIAYLRKRASFLRRGPVVRANGELELLAYYLKNLDGREHEFVVPPRDPPADTLVVEGEWETFVESGPYRRKKAADHESYLWDRIIEEIAGHADRGTLVAGQERGLSGIEEQLRVLAAEDRFTRRLLSSALNGVRDLAARSTENVRFRTSRSGYVADRAYVFLTLKRDGIDPHEYRRHRQMMLRAHLDITKLRQEALQVVVGIGVAPANDPDESIDLAVRTFSDWTDDDRDRTRQMCDALGWVHDTTNIERHIHHDEFPAPFPRLHRQRTSARDPKNDAKAKRKAQRAARKKTRR